MAVYTTASHTWVVGETVTAANMNAQVRDLINGFGAFTAYTPVWTGTTTNPVLGNGTLTGAYTQIGKLVTFWINLTIGSTTTFGSGGYVLTVPVTGSTNPGNQVFAARYFDVSTGFLYRGTSVVGASALTRTLFVDGALSTGGWSPTVPVTMAVGDIVNFSGTYEAA